MQRVRRRARDDYRGTAAMHTAIAELEQAQIRSDIPEFRPGDTLKVHVRVKEGSRSRIQVFQGVVLRRQGGGARETFTVRKISYGVGEGAQDGRRRALTGRDGADGPGRDHAERAGLGPDGELRGSPMAGTAARPEPADSLAAPDAASEQARARKARRPRSFWRELPVLFVIALLIALLIKSFVVQPFYIPSSSMENTLDIGDKVLVNKLVYHFRPIKPGDIVVFNGVGSWDPLRPPCHGSADPLVRLYDVTLDPLFRSILGLFGTAPGQHDYIKRVIGVPGDHVACCTPSGDVTVNMVPLTEKSYLYPGNVPSTQRFSITVPPGRLWVMGDHRAASSDSRLHLLDPGAV